MSGSAVLRCGVNSLGVHDGICHGAHGFLQNVAEVAAGAEVGRGKEIYAVLARFEGVAFLETAAGFIIRVINGHAQASLLAHHGEAGHIGGAIAYVNHVPEGNRSQFAVHVVVHILDVVEHALVDPKEVLCFAGVGDDSFREADAAIFFAEFATENFAHVRADDGAIQNALDTAGDDVELYPHPGKTVLFAEGAFFKFLEELRDAPVIGQLFAQLTQVLVAHAIQPEGVQNLFQVAQLAVPAFVAAPVVALAPELLGINSVFGEECVLLHVVRTQRLVKVKNKSDCILGNGHIPSYSLSVAILQEKTRLRTVRK